MHTSPALDAPPDVAPAAFGQLGQALASAKTMEEALNLINATRELILGPGLLTINLNVTSPQDRADEVQLQRLWSSDPVAYPLSGRKRKALTAWTRQLLLRAEMFVGEGDAALAAVFDDHAQIAALGWHAVVNVPLVEAGRCFATFNVLGPRPRWLPQQLEAAQRLALLATPWVLRARALAGTNVKPS